MERQECFERQECVECMEDRYPLLISLSSAKGKGKDVLENTKNDNDRAYIACLYRQTIDIGDAWPREEIGTL